MGGNRGIRNAAIPSAKRLAKEGRCLENIMNPNDYDQ